MCVLIVITIYPGLIPCHLHQYPTLKLLNKQFRVSVSPKPLNLTGNMAYNLFAAANKAGWFAALRNGVTQGTV